MKTKLFLVAFTLMQVFVFASCSSSDDDDSTIVTSSKELSLSHEQTSQITCSASNVTYESENKFVATVSTSGLVTANCIGQTYIKVNGKRAVKVTVNPVNTYFVEPLYDFNLTKANVKSKLGTPYNETDNGLAYRSTSSRINAYAYLFDENNKLKASSMMVKSTYLSSLMDFISERYLPLDYDEDTSTAYCVNGSSKETITMAVSVQVYNSSNIQVKYYPVDLTKSKISVHKQIKSHYTNMLKDINY